MADLLAWIHAVWTPWLDVALVTVVGTVGLLWALKTADKEKARKPRLLGDEAGGCSLACTDGDHTRSWPCRLSVMEQTLDFGGAA